MKNFINAKPERIFFNQVAYTVHASTSLDNIIPDNFSRAEVGEELLELSGNGELYLISVSGRGNSAMIYLTYGLTAHDAVSRLHEDGDVQDLEDVVNIEIYGQTPINVYDYKDRD